jgi:hypothetical protein
MEFNIDNRKVLTTRRYFARALLDIPQNHKRAYLSLGTGRMSTRGSMIGATGILFSGAIVPAEGDLLIIAGDLNNKLLQHARRLIELDIDAGWILVEKYLVSEGGRSRKVIITQPQSPGTLNAPCGVLLIGAIRDVMAEILDEPRYNGVTASFLFGGHGQKMGVYSTQLEAGGDAATLREVAIDAITTAVKVEMGEGSFDVVFCADVAIEVSGRTGTAVYAKDNKLQTAGEAKYMDLFFRLFAGAGCIMSLRVPGVDKVKVYSPGGKMSGMLMHLPSVDPDIGKLQAMLRKMASAKRKSHGVRMELTLTMTANTAADVVGRNFGDPELIGSSNGRLFGLMVEHSSFVTMPTRVHDSVALMLACAISGVMFTGRAYINSTTASVEMNYRIMAVLLCAPLILGALGGTIPTSPGAVQQLPYGTPLRKLYDLLFAHFGDYIWSLSSTLLGPLFAAPAHFQAFHKVGVSVQNGTYHHPESDWLLEIAAAFRNLTNHDLSLYHIQNMPKIRSLVDSALGFINIKAAGTKVEDGQIAVRNLISEARQAGRDSVELIGGFLRSHLAHGIMGAYSNINGERVKYCRVFNSLVGSKMSESLGILEANKIYKTAITQHAVVTVKPGRKRERSESTDVEDDPDSDYER